MPYPPEESLAGESARLRAAAAAVRALRPAVEAGEPWPLAERFGTEPEASWGPREVLAHLAEMLPFWLGEMERVVAADSQPYPFGRVADDPIRIATIERDRTLPLRELFARIDDAADRYARRLPELDPDTLTRRGLHPRLGEMTVAEMLERFVVRHLAEHADQLGETLPR
jgi:hypothetical protein